MQGARSFQEAGRQVGYASMVERSLPSSKVTVLMRSELSQEGQKVALRRGQPMGEILGALARQQSFANATSIRRQTPDDKWVAVHNTGELHDGDELWVDLAAAAAPEPPAVRAAPRPQATTPAQQQPAQQQQQQQQQTLVLYQVLLSPVPVLQPWFVRVLPCF